MNRREFALAITTAPTAHERVAWFGALLAAESGLHSDLIVVGGSAIEVYLTSAKYVSGDIDIVGRKAAIVPVLKKWGFKQRKGRDHRVYWVMEGVGLVDLVGSISRAGLPPRPYPTPFGEVNLGPVEALIVRRLVRASRESSDELFRQAEALAIEYRKHLDWRFLVAAAKYERIQPLLRELRNRITAND